MIPSKMVKYMSCTTVQGWPAFVLAKFSRPFSGYSSARISKCLAGMHLEDN